MAPFFLAQCQPRLGQIVLLRIGIGQWRAYLYGGDHWQAVHSYRRTQPDDCWKPLPANLLPQYRQPT